MSRDRLDLRDQAAVNYWFQANRPEYVFLAAGTVGGITCPPLFGWLLFVRVGKLLRGASASEAPIERAFVAEELSLF